jgi:hypothetical protein
MLMVPSASHIQSLDMGPHGLVQPVHGVYGLSLNIIPVCFRRTIATFHREEYAAALLVVATVPLQFPAEVSLNLAAMDEELIEDGLVLRLEYLAPANVDLCGDLILCHHIVETHATNAL